MNPVRIFFLFAACGVTIALADPIESTPKLDILNEQIAASPDDAKALSNRGYVLALLGRKEEARADLKKVVELKDNAPMHNRVGWAYFNMGDYEDALREFEIAAEMMEYKAHYDHYSIVLACWGLGDFGRAMEHYQLAAERDARLADAKSLAERIMEWTPQEKQAMNEIYTLWSKAYRP